MVRHLVASPMDSIHSSPKTIMLHLPLCQLTTAGALCVAMLGSFIIPLQLSVSLCCVAMMMSWVLLWQLLRN
jgi:hypothetical protein